MGKLKPIVLAEADTVTVYLTLSPTLFFLPPKPQFCSTPRWLHVTEEAGLSLGSEHKSVLVQADHDVTIPLISGQFGNEYETRFWPMRWEIISYC